MAVFPSAAVLLVVLAAAYAAAEPAPMIPLEDFALTTAKGVRASGFSFRDCGDASYRVKFGAVSLTPDPVHLPGNLTLNAAFSMGGTTNVTAPVAVQATLRKKAGVWFDIPCVGQIGSCKYPDMCPFLAWMTHEAKLHKCQSTYIHDGIPCECPIHPFAAKLVNQVVEIAEIGPIPKFLTNGEYYGKFDSPGVFCFEATVVLTSI